MHRSNSDNFSYSAEIDMWLDCGSLGRLPLRQTAPTFVIVAEPRDIPACDAEIVYTIDGRPHRRAVRLVNGVSTQSVETMVLSRDAISPF